MKKCGEQKDNEFSICIDCRFYRKTQDDCTLQNVIHKQKCKDYEYDDESYYAEAEKKFFPNGYLNVDVDDSFEEQNNW